MHLIVYHIFVMRFERNVKTNMSYIVTEGSNDADGCKITDASGPAAWMHRQRRRDKFETLLLSEEDRAICSISQPRLVTTPHMHPANS